MAVKKSVNPTNPETKRLITPTPKSTRRVNAKPTQIESYIPVAFAAVAQSNALMSRESSSSTTSQAASDVVPGTIEEITVDELTAEEQLTNIGRDRGFVTYDDILGLFPDAEKNLEQMEDVFAGLSDANIAVVASEDEAADQMVDDDDDDDDEWNERNNENLLEAIEADDTVGLYLKEIGRVPLLTAAQEVDLAQRMERGRAARDEVIANARGMMKERERLEWQADDGMAAREHLINANSRSSGSPSTVKSTTLCTGTMRSSWCLICSITAGVPLVTMVMRDT